MSYLPTDIPYMSEEELEANVLNDCFLCEYTKDNSEHSISSIYYYYPICNKCPINWSPLAVCDNYPNLNRETCSARYMKYDGLGASASTIYLYAPISEILALQEKEDSKCTM